MAIAEVKLTQDRVALIDDADLHLCAGYKWQFAPANPATDRNPGYAVSNTTGGQLPMHRLILSAPQGLEVDHRNGNGLDNRRENLRLATKSQNTANRGKPKNGARRFKGVRWDSIWSCWMAILKFQGRTYRVAPLPTEEAAALAYDDLARIHHGEFACVNFPRSGEAAASSGVGHV